ncbi:MAG: hypothetical protein ACK4JY_07790 [Brevundimonas sp.]|uniref:hypothetical protein n=1 Tax=Brevundimonas sp. TaxID=1871086 RepID=UPI00391AFFFB
MALLGGFLLYRQIRQERDFEHQRLERRYRAARAVTPLALNAVIDWAETMIHQWVLAGRRVDQSMFDEIFPVAPGGPTAPTVFDIVFPRLDRSVVRDLQGMIEATFADKDASPFVALLQRIQIMESRSQGFHAKLNSPRTVEVLVGPYCFGQAAECAEVHARAKTLFRFARNDEATKSSEVTLTEIQESLYLAKAYEGSNPEVFEAAERAFGPG